MWEKKEEQGSDVYYSTWGHKELDMTEWLNWTDKGKEYEKE